MSKKTILIFILIAAFSVPVVGHAALQDDLQDQIQNLLRLVSSLQVQLNAIENNTVSNFTSCIAAGNSAMESYPRQCAHNGKTFVEVILAEPDTQSLVCPMLSRGLRIGASGSDVSSLQNFLRSVGFYTYPVITGYYGVVTQQAVQQWQAQNGVVSFGTPNTTGFGSIGPATRTAIQRMCGGALPDPKPTLCTLQYDPVCGKTPGICTDTLYGGSCADGETKTYGNSCQLKAAGAELQYKGECRLDIPTKAPNNCKVWDDGCNTCSRSYEGGPLACTLRACIWQGISKCNAYFNDEPEFPNTSIDFSVTPKSGAAPLSVTFTAPGGYSCADGNNYRIEFGDGISAMTPSCTIGSQKVSHTYSQIGTYTATLYSIPSGFGSVGYVDTTPRAVKTLKVTVADTSSIACTTEYVPVCGIRPWICTAPVGALCGQPPQSSLRTTYSNSCELHKAEASYLHQGACAEQ